MNKDVIYIEPEDDITDILSKLRQSKQKIVALVPTKKIGVLRSAVNTKLIAKTANIEEKTVVIVSTDVSMMKLAMGAGIPVAKNLQSRPILPSELDEIIAKQEQVKDNVISEDADRVVKEAEGKSDFPIPETAEKAPTGRKIPINTEQVEEMDSSELEEDAEKAKKAKRAKKNKSKVPDFNKHQRKIILGVVGGVVTIALVVWATLIAPSAKITVAIRTNNSNFSKNISLTTKQADQDLKAGKFYIEQVRSEKKASIEFTATGQKDIGEKAKGTLVISTAFPMDLAGEGGSVSVPAGTKFSTNGLSYTLNNSVDLRWDGNSLKKCNSIAHLVCEISASANVTAVESGEKYNISANIGGWVSSMDGVFARNKEAFAGGTTKLVTVVQQSDIDKAKESLSNDGAKDGKKELEKKFDKDLLGIVASYKQTVEEPMATPALGAVVESGVKPKLEMKTTFSMYGIAYKDIEKFVKTEVGKDLSKSQKIYSPGKPFIERFSEESEGVFSAKLKTSAKVGPKVTHEDVLEKSKGRKIGEVQSILKSIEGIADVKIQPSFFWVNSVPTDPNRVSIELKVED